jgi:hypothetical protein
MQLSSIKEFLEVYRTRLLKEDDKRLEVTEIIKKITGVTVPLSDMKIARGVVVIKTNPIVKNEIFLYKEKILEELKSKNRNDIFDIT